MIRSADPESAQRLYGDLGLGLRLAVDREFPQWGMRLQFFRVGDATLEVASALASGESEDERELPNAGVDDLWGVSWRVGDVDRARERLEAALWHFCESR